MVTFPERIASDADCRDTGLIGSSGSLSQGAPQRGRSANTEGRKGGREALERWETEGGRIATPHRSPSAGSPRAGIRYPPLRAFFLVVGLACAMILSRPI